jgi:hypothetical protein
MAVAAILFAYGYVQRFVGFGRVPPLVPQHHFYFHLAAVGHVLTAVGAWAIVTGAVGAIVRRVGWAGLRERHTAVSAALVLAGVSALVGANYVSYQMRPDFEEYQREALGVGEEFARTRVLERLRTETPSEAVVLATATDSYYRVGPAGRATVAVPAIQSNPYVTQGGRDRDQEAMLAALLAKDFPTFRALADKYDVSYVLLGPEDTAALDASGPPAEEVQEVSRSAGYALYARAKRRTTDEPAR